MDKVISKNGDDQHQYTILAIDGANDVLALLESELSEEGYRVLLAKNGCDRIRTIRDRKCRSCIARYFDA